MSFGERKPRVFMCRPNLIHEERHSATCTPAPAPPRRGPADCPSAQRKPLGDNPPIPRSLQRFTAPKSRINEKGWIPAQPQYPLVALLNTFPTVSPLTEPYTLTLDALTLSLETDPQAPALNLAYINYTFPLIGKNHRIANNLALQQMPLRSKDRTGTFRQAFDVHADGQPIGVLRTDPQGVCAEEIGLVSFEFANWLFYTQTGWYEYYQMLRKVLRLNCRCITYGEIALDSNWPFLYQIDTIFHATSFSKRRDVPARYKSVLPRLTGSPDGEGGYVFGKSARGPRSNGKQVACYDKTLEIAKSGKGYITEYHQLNGVDTSQTVNRIEARFASRWASPLGVTVEDLNNPKRLVEIFAHALRDVFTFNDLTQPERDVHRNLKFARLSLLDVAELPPQRLHKIVRAVQEDMLKLRKRGALREAVNDWIESGSAPTAAYIRHFIQQPHPKGRPWPQLIEQYARDYIGPPLAGVTGRLATVAQLYQQPLALAA